MWHLPLSGSAGAEQLEWSRLEWPHKQILEGYQSREAVHMDPQ